MWYDEIVFSALLSLKFKPMIFFGKKGLVPFCALLVIMTCSALCVAKKALAQETSADEIVGISIDQSAFAFDLAQGEEKKFKVNVVNISANEQRMSAEKQDFSVADNNEITFIDGDNEAYGMRSWLEIPVDPWLLSPNETREIEFSIVVPKDAVVGSHYGAVMLRAFPEINVDNFQTTIVSGRVGIYVLINVLGEKSGAGKITKFDAPLVADKDVVFNTEFANNGTIHYIPHGEISVRNFFTRKTETVELEKHFVFPGKKYSFAAKWNVKSLFGVYVAQASFTDGDGRAHQTKKMLFGKYSFVTILGFIAVLIVITKTGYGLCFRKKQS